MNIKLDDIIGFFGSLKTITGIFGIILLIGYIAGLILYSIYAPYCVQESEIPEDKKHHYCFKNKHGRFRESRKEWTT